MPPISLQSPVDMRPKPGANGEAPGLHQFRSVCPWRERIHTPPHRTLLHCEQHRASSNRLRDCPIQSGRVLVAGTGGHFDNTHVHRTDARCRPRSRLCDCSSGPGVRTGRVSGGKRAVTNPSFVKPRRWFLRLGPLLQSSQIHDVRRHNRPGGNKCCLRSNAPVTKVRRKTQAPWYSDAKIGRHDYCFECLRRRDTSA